MERSKAAMSNKHKEAGGMTTDFTKFPDAEIRKVRQGLLKSQGVFLLEQVLVKEGAVDQLRHPLHTKA